jgi:excisionase family DNA binding protein
MPRVFLTVSDVVRRFDGNVSADAVRRAERRGELRAVRTLGGVRLFTEYAVDRWMAKRQREAADSVINAGSDAA